MHYFYPFMQLFDCNMSFNPAMPDLLKLTMQCKTQLLTSEDLKKQWSVVPDLHN